MNLKITLIALVLSTGINHYTAAQTSKHEIGIHGGASLSHFNGYHASKLYNRPNSGFYYGIGYQWNTKGHFSLRTEFNSERKGAIDQANNSPSSRTILDLDYFTLPILSQFHFGKKVQYFFQFGPYISYLSQVSKTYPKSDFYNYSQIFMRYEAGATFGTGVSAYLSSHFKLLVEFRYNQGLTYLYYHSKHSSSNSNIRNFSLIGLVGLNYCFGKRE
ncbi:porin family protein [Fluviicola sp.]|uniref:porin family protein n=1 Tax=Fluviicola sp. TaxID=1917219 RepID=UPI00261D51E2|nr:porin family protein [Fluviicola sp.]